MRDAQHDLGAPVSPVDQQLVGDLNTIQQLYCDAGGSSCFNSRQACQSLRAAVEGDVSLRAPQKTV
jgi:hypothetical protein